MQEIVYSIIIPHYNIPDLLKRCLASIPEREDIQVIVVDDCSPEADRYIPKNVHGNSPLTNNPYVEFYSTKTGGSAGRARNVGIEHAKGRWLTFIDADDLLVENAEQLLDKYKDREEEVLYFQTKSVMSDDLSELSGRNCFQYHFEQYLKNGNETLLRLEFDAPWGKFVKRSLIDKHHIRFDEVRYGNDVYFSAAIGIFAKTIGVPHEAIYVNTERKGSLTAEKMKSIEEWEIRYHSALHTQQLFDQQGITYKRYNFNDYLILMWHRNKVKFVVEFIKLSFRNKLRVIYCALRSLR